MVIGLNGQKEKQLDRLHIGSGITQRVHGHSARPWSFRWEVLRPLQSAPPLRPAEKPKWKPPPQVAIVPPLTGDNNKEVDSSAAAADNKPAISQFSPLGVPSDG